MKWKVEWKVPLCKWHTFWMTPWLIYFSTLILLHIKRKRLLRRNLATIALLESKLCVKFQRFNAIDRSIEILKSNWISKNFKTFYEFQTTICLKKIIRPLHHVKPSCFSGAKYFGWRFTGICRYLLSNCFENAALGRREMVQYKYLLWHQPETCFWLCRGSWGFYNVEWVEVRKISEVFKAKLYWKLVFASFCWLWDFLPENLKLVDKLKDEVFDHLFSGPNFGFWDCFMAF